MPMRNDTLLIFAPPDQRMMGIIERIASRASPRRWYSPARPSLFAINGRIC